MQIAAAVGLVVLGGIGGWAARDLTDPVSLLPLGAVARMITADAIAAHRTSSVEVRHPVEVNPGQETQIVQWLLKRLGRQLLVPDLSAAGFRLMGGRLLPAEDGSAAQFYFGYAVAAKADRNLLLRVAEFVYRQTTQDGAGAKIPPALGKPS